MPGSADRTQTQTRDRVLHLLRFGPKTVEELAAVVGLTLNGIRSQLAVLERDGLIARRGVRHGPGPGKPPLLYTITPRAEGAFSEAYAPALATLVTTLAERLPPVELHAAFTAAGSAISQPRPGGVSAMDHARALLESLGAAVAVDAEGDPALVRGAACPLAAAVRGCPDTCELVRSMLAQSTGVEVTTRCEHDASPRCRFHLQGA